MQAKGKESLTVTAAVLFVVTEEKLFSNVRQF